MARQLAQRKAEFRDYVWDHAADAFQAKFDIRAELTRDEIIFLRRILQPTRLAAVHAVEAEIQRALEESPEHLHLLLQITGLTRNKIVQDIKAYVRSRRLRIPVSSASAILRHDEGCRIGCQYLARQVIRVFGGISTRLSADLLEIVNQATWPGYIRQERAKRMGHEAEYRLACLLRDCGLDFAPPMKAENPLCPDVIIGGISYDLVAPSEDHALVRIKATVHTANIGQYGESKDDLEMRAAKTAIAREKRDTKVTLLAFIDGVGFESNRAGLEGVLAVADEFCQFRTIWKAASIVAAKAGRSITVALPRGEIGRFQDFANRHGTRLIAATDDMEGADEWEPAGDGYILKERRRAV